MNYWKNAMDDMDKIRRGRGQFTDFDDCHSFLKLLDHNRRYESCLEYGCGNGRLLDILKNVFPVCDGYDPNNSKYDKLPNRKYDVVFTYTVLKHLSYAEQMEVILKSYDLLSDTGVMIHDLPTCATHFREGEPRGDRFIVETLNYMFFPTGYKLYLHDIASFFLIIDKKGSGNVVIPNVPAEEEKRLIECR